MSVVTPCVGASFDVLLFSGSNSDKGGLGMAWIMWFVSNVSLAADFANVPSPEEMAGMPQLLCRVFWFVHYRSSVAFNQDIISASRLDEDIRPGRACSTGYLLERVRDTS